MQGGGPCVQARPRGHAVQHNTGPRPRTPRAAVRPPTWPRSSRRSDHGAIMRPRRGRLLRPLRLHELPERCPPPPLGPPPPKWAEATGSSRRRRAPRAGTPSRLGHGGRHGLLAHRQRLVAEPGRRRHLQDCPGHSRRPSPAGLADTAGLWTKAVSLIKVCPENARRRCAHSSRQCAHT
jgi:hypothetical protein